MDEVLGGIIIGLFLGLFLGVTLTLALVDKITTVAYSIESTQDICEQELVRSNKCVQVWVDEDALNRMKGE